MKKYTDINAETIDRWVKQGWEWGIPINHESFELAKKGDWKLVLTPTKAVPSNWFPKSLTGLKILGLASGGGQQMPIFAARGAIVTVLDYSLLQLESEAMVAKREGYQIEIVHHDMTKPLPFDDATFDIIFHPVSNCYVKEVTGIFKECYRILKTGGILMCGLDNGVNFMSDDEVTINNKFPFDPLVNEEQLKNLQATDCGIQFSHTLEEQIGGQLSAGFSLTDIYDDTNGAGRLHDLNIPTFFATRAVKL